MHYWLKATNNRSLMSWVRCIAPAWLKEVPTEGNFSQQEIQKLNLLGFNIYYFPNYPKDCSNIKYVSGHDIDTFEWVFVDMDLKDGIYKTKDEFIEKLAELLPTKIVDSGRGIHAYWKVADLDAKSYLRLSRRLLRKFNTDEACQKICQLMRLPNTFNTKDKDNFIQCEVLATYDKTYTCEELDSKLPLIMLEDENYCIDHYNRTYMLAERKTIIDVMPAKWGKLLAQNHEVKKLWAGNSKDRSSDDYRLGHIMHAHGFTPEEARTVLGNSAKALERSPIHRVSYADLIINKLWTYESAEDKKSVPMTSSVRSLLLKGKEVLAGDRFPCNKIIDDTEHGFRIGQVIGIVGGSGVGKTTLTLNAFLWFAENNPDYHHIFFSLEQPPGEIALRIRTICQGNETLFDKIHIVTNEDENGNYFQFSIDLIQQHIINYEKQLGIKIGACVIDHIGVLDKSSKFGESEGLIGVCKRMKDVARKTKTLMMMLSQAPREKAGIGDLELNKDAAFGTVFFESFVDYVLLLWQPLKRVYAQGAPTIMAFKFGKIRHKRQGKDKIQEDICYQLFFDPNTEVLRELTQDEQTSADYFLKIATNIRNKDMKTDLVEYKPRRILEGKNVTINNHRPTSRH